MAEITKPVVPNRSKIVLENDDEVKFWCKHFGVTREELTLAIEKVGNSAAAVRKQLAQGSNISLTGARQPRRA